MLILLKRKDKEKIANYAWRELQAHPGLRKVIDKIAQPQIDSLHFYATRKAIEIVQQHRKEVEEQFIKLPTK